MKIRMDFVTNSSSSSFVAVLNLNLEGGGSVSAVYQNDIGEEDLIRPVDADYGMNAYDIRSMEEYAGMYVNKDGEKKKITSGSLRLMAYAVGEYGYTADPEDMLSEYLGKEWEDVFRKIRELSAEVRKSPILADEYDEEEINELIRAEYDEYADEDELVSKRKGAEWKEAAEKIRGIYTEARKIPFLEKYSDDSVRALIRAAYTDGFESGTEVRQTLYKDGSCELKIDTDCWFDLVNSEEWEEPESRPGLRVENGQE